jgi:hypothetical protein
MYKEYRNDRDQLHRAGGPAVESDRTSEWWAEGRRHRDDGPAIVTVNGTEWYYWRGTLVPEHVIMNPRGTKPVEILKEENIEVRRAWMEAYDMTEFMEAMNPEVIDDDKANERMLVKLDVPKGKVQGREVEDEPFVAVKVKNSTPEPDGRYKYYFLRVPPDTKTAAEGVAWTFGMDKKEYAPTVET